jgi:hypothetical protein
MQLPKNSLGLIKAGLWAEVKRVSFQGFWGYLKQRFPELKNGKNIEEIIQSLPVQPNLLYRLIMLYRARPKTKPHLLTVLLLGLYPQMEATLKQYYGILKRIESFDPFSEVYWLYLQAILKESLNPDTDIAQAISQLVRKHISIRRRYEE